MSDQDRQDIRAVLEGDEEACVRLIRRYQAPVTARMHRFTRDRLELEELVQDVFVEAFLSLKTYRFKAPFLHWLRRIATRVGYRYWKKKDRERKRLAWLAEDAELKRALEAVPDEPSDAAEALHRLLENLNSKDRLILTLVYFEELSPEEIADQTGWSRTLIKVRAHRARKKLKTLLEEAGFRGKNNG